MKRENIRNCIARPRGFLGETAPAATTAAAVVVDAVAVAAALYVREHFVHYSSLIKWLFRTFARTQNKECCVRLAVKFHLRWKGETWWIKSLGNVYKTNTNIHMYVVHVLRLKKFNRHSFEFLVVIRHLIISHTLFSCHWWCRLLYIVCFRWNFQISIQSKFV